VITRAKYRNDRYRREHKKGIRIMKKFVVAMLVVAVTASIAAAGCGTCAPKKKPAAPKTCCPATAAKATAEKATCPMAPSLEKLNLTEEQKSKIESICAECKVKCDKEGKTCSAKCKKAINEVLTVKQRAEFRKLCKAAKTCNK